LAKDETVKDLSKH